LDPAGRVYVAGSDPITKLAWRGISLDAAYDDPLHHWWLASDRLRSKTFLSKAALACLLATSALAQQSPPTTSDTANNAVTTPKSTDTGAATTTGTTTAPIAIHFLQVQQDMQVFASRVMGAYVVNDAGQTVGSVNDIIFEKQGKIVGIVVGVGGFLGIGETNVAIEYEPSQIAVDDSGNHIIKLNVTKAVLQNSPN
jgi:sporulation protein YlmC with PRC-barrel domain